MRLHFRQNGSCYVCALVKLRGQTRVSYLFSVRARRPKVLAFSAAVVCDDLICRRKNFLRRTVVLFKPYNFRSLKLLFKIEDIVYIRAHKAVYALVIIAHHADVFSVAEQAHKLVLKRVRILIFVHQNIFKAPADSFSYLVVPGKQSYRFKNQVIKVKSVRFAKPLSVSRINLGYFRERRIVAVRYVFFQLLGRLKSRFCARNCFSNNSRRI